MNLINALNLNTSTLDVISIVCGGGKTNTLFRLTDELIAANKRVIVTATTRLSPKQVAARPDAATVQVIDNHLPLDEISARLDAHNHCLLISPPDGHKQPGISEQLVDELASQAETLGIDTIIAEADGSRTRPVKAPAEYEPALPASTTILMPVMGMDGIGTLIRGPQVHRPERIENILEINNQDGLTRLTPKMAARLLVHEQGGAKSLPETARLVPLLNKADNAAHLAMARLIAKELASQGQGSLIGQVGILKREPIIERWGPQAVVVLAAGASRRMGRSKQVEVVDGEMMVVRAVRNALASGADRVFVVTGAYEDKVIAALEAIQADEPRLQFVHNTEWETGQASSVRAAIHALGDSSISAITFMPVDQPFLPSSLLQRVMYEWRVGAQLVAPTVDGKLRGAPALWDRVYWPELLTLDGDVGARPILQKYQNDVAAVSVKAELLRDIDSPEDL
ncbi:MAG: selenium cofactor biosynthesis protein YqeC [Chloroflexota bacterium]